MKYRIAGSSHIGRIRSANQDNYYCEGSYRQLTDEFSSFEKSVEKQGAWFAAIFDGMGGEKDGEIASLIAAEMTDDYCRSSGRHGDLGELISRINDRICREMESRRSSMGSTCVYLEFDENRCRSLNIGDSRAYLLKNGVMTQLSEDHTEAASMSALINDDAAKGRYENSLTQYLGIPEDDFIIEPFVSSWSELQPGDMLLLCSDGLTHYAEESAIKNILSSDMTLTLKRDRLADMALEKGGADNITVLIIETN